MNRVSSAFAALLALLLNAVAGTSAPAASAQTAAPPETRHIYISALDRKGTPLKDLTAREVSVREDGVTREIVGIERATAPLTIALLVDDTGPGLRFIREGVGTFIQRLGGLAEIALVSTGGRNTVLVDFTARVDTLYQGIRQLITRTTSGAYLLDGVREAITALNAREAERPVIVVLTLEGAEFSSIRADRLLDELQRSRAVLHVVSLGKPTLKTMTGWNEMPSQSLRENLDENINRKKFLEIGSRQSGGTLEQVLVDSGVPAALQGVADELSSQYVVVYRRPGGPAAPKKINVSVQRTGIKVRARSEPPGASASK